MYLLRLFTLFSIYFFQLIQTQRGRGKEHSSNDYINLNVNRTIELDRNIITITTKLIIKLMKIDPVYSYKFPIMKNSSKYLINLAANMKSTDEEESAISLKISKIIKPTDEFDFYEINFRNEPMNYEEERLLIIKEHYFEKLELLPRKISLKQDQLVLLFDSVNHISFYTTNSQKVRVVLPHQNSKIIDYTRLNNTSILGDSIYYEINEPINPLQFEKFNIHYENNKPIGVFNYAQKIFEVSHWGNIAIEERFQIENIGALLEGEFGRVDYDEHGRGGGTSIALNFRKKCH